MRLNITVNKTDKYFTQEPSDDVPGPSTEPDPPQGPSVIKSSAESEPLNSVELENVSISLEKSVEESNHTDLRTVLVSPVSMWRSELLHVLFRLHSSRTCCFTYRVLTRASSHAEFLHVLFRVQL